MNATFGRTSENVLFTVLIAAVLAWTAVSVASDQPPQRSSDVCLMDGPAHHLPVPAVRSRPAK